MYTDKVKQPRQIILIEEEEIVLDKKRLTQKFNIFFINVVPNLNIRLDNTILTDTGNIENPILKSDIKTRY